MEDWFVVGDDDRGEGKGRKEGSKKGRGDFRGERCKVWRRSLVIFRLS